MRSRLDGEGETDKRTCNKINLARPEVVECDVGTRGRCLDSVDERGSSQRVGTLVHRLIGSTLPAKESVA
jgi:hypothetical protein